MGLLLLAWLAACAPEPVGTPEAGWLGEGIANPYPSNLLIGEDGHLAVPADALPVTLGGVPLPMERMAWRTGFSPAQPIVVRLDGVNVAALPGWEEPTPGAGGVRLYDLDSGEAIEVMAELDAWEDLERPPLLIRPLRALTPGHRVGVVVTTEVVPRPAAYEAILSAGKREAGPLVERARALHAELAELGVAEAEIALAWEFPVDAGRTPLESALAQVPTPTAWRFTRVRDRAAGDDLMEGFDKVLVGTFDTVDFLVDDLQLNAGSDGTVSPTGTAEALLWVAVPEGMSEAEARSAPILVFGHGLFSHPSAYLDVDGDTSRVGALAKALGAIVIATSWRGLMSDDRVEALQAAGNFGLLPLVPERVVQGHANQRAMINLALEGGLLDDPLLANAAGEPLGDPTRLRYYGISLGGIEGQVLAATEPRLQAAVLHVPGGFWTHLFERSSQWPPFEYVLAPTLEDPADRQWMLAGAQLWFDAVDPAAWTPELATAPILLQESIGDEQVANFTTRAMARSLGATQLGPAIHTVSGVQVVPDQVSGPAYVQFNAEVPLPNPGNRPPSPSGAHTEVRRYPGVLEQTVTFLSDDSLGSACHHCGGAPCAASNPGEAP